MLIPGKSHSRVNSRNSQVSIETFDFTRVGTFTGMIWAGSPAGAKGGGQAIAGRSPTLFPANVATPSIDTAGSGASETSQKRLGEGATGECDQGSAMADRPLDDGTGNRRPPPSDAAGQSVDVAGGWTRKMAGSSRFSGTVAHPSKHRLGTWSPTRPQAPRRCSPTSQWSFLLPIQANWSGCICTDVVL